MLQLNFNLETNEERKELVEQFLRDNPNYKFTKKELETIGTYLVCGKDENGSNPVLEKYIELDTKYNSYKKQKPESLEALLESPTFSETEVNASPIKYKRVKNKIDREVDKDIPGLSDLFTIIDHYQELVDAAEKGENPSIDSTKLYHLKHFLIDLRKEQYRIKGDYLQEQNQTISNEASRPIDEAIDWDAAGSLYSIKPLGLYLETSKNRFENFFVLNEKDYIVPETPYQLDFTNPNHIYALLESYNALLTENYENPESTVNYILKTLDFYINYADLAPIRKDIVDMKKIEAKNAVIQNRLYTEYGVTYSLNYISTIYKQQICGEIAKAAQLHYDSYLERENPSSWKKCTRCGRQLLRDSRNFMMKSKSADGYSSKCKRCLKEERDARKATPSI